MAKQSTNPNQRQGGKPDREGFTQVKNRRRSKGGGPSKTRKDPMVIDPSSNNPFDILGKKECEGGISEDKGDQGKLTEKIKGMEKEEEHQTPMEGTKEDEVEEMELGELDLDVIKAEHGKKGNGYVSRRKLELLQEAILRT